MSVSGAMPDLVEGYDEKHALEIMRMLNQDRKVQKEFCDGTIISHGKEHSVHKCIVGVVSEFFKCSFVTEMQEKYDNVVRMEKVTSETLENILDFIYTGVVKVTDDNVIDLLDGAEFTQIPRIKRNCSKHLEQNMNVENCLKLRAYAQRYSLQNLHDAFEQVIVENFVEVLEQDDFEKLNAEDITTIIGNKKDQAEEEAAFTAIVHWVNHNLEERRALFSNLFSLVDLSFVSETFLNEKVKSEPLVFDTLECLQRLLSSSIRLSAVHRQRLIPELSIIVMGGNDSENKCFLHHVNPVKTDALPMLNVGRCAAAACKIGNHLYLIGGGNEVIGGKTLKSVEVLDLQSRTAWNEVANMLKSRNYFACAVLDDSIYVCGGWNNGYLSSCEKYDCATQQWSRTSDMLFKRGYNCMAVLDGSLFCVGGYNGDNNLLSAECYDTATDEWREISPMNVRRRRFALVALHGHLYAIGGDNDDDVAFARAEKYDPKSDKWTEVQPLQVARYNHGAVIFNEQIYAFGGESNNGSVTSIEVYDEVEDKWEICYEMESIPYGATIYAVCGYLA